MPFSRDPQDSYLEYIPLSKLTAEFPFRIKTDKMVGKRHVFIGTPLLGSVFKHPALGQDSQTQKQETVFVLVDYEGRPA